MLPVVRGDNDARSAASERPVEGIACLRFAELAAGWARLHPKRALD